jgi:cell division septal protein FtsQ
MAGNDFTMTVGEFVELEDTNSKVFVVNTAHIVVIAKVLNSWQVRLTDGTVITLGQDLAYKFMHRLTGMPVQGAPPGPHATTE